ncbi:MAG: acyl-CoA dehydrogenase family protein [Acidimicrobiales bacterium]
MGVVAEEVLFPSAQETDRAERVPAGHLAALAGAGAFGIAGSVEPIVRRQIHRILGGACGATYFVWAQHEGPVRLLGASANEALKARWLDRLLAGEVVGGTAFAHLRRPGPPLVRAEPDGAGWRLHGEAPWATGWGMAGVYSIGATTPSGSVLWVLLPADRLTPSPPLELAVLQATVTVRLRFDGTAVAADDVMLELDRSLWDLLDDSIGNRGNPAVQGVALRALELLEATGPAGGDLAAVLRPELARVIEVNEALAVAADAGQVDVPAMAAARAEAIDLAQRAALALLAAVGGRGVETSHPAQRLVREAAFYTIQARPVKAGRPPSTWPRLRPRRPSAGEPVSFRPQRDQAPGGPASSWGDVTSR